MRRWLLAGASGLLLLTGVAAGAVLVRGRSFERTSTTGALTHPGTDLSFELIERGRALATAADCVACHTLPGGKPWAGGLVLQTPFGRIAAPNITPDRTTGIGAYTEEDLVRLLRVGIGRGGKHVYPAMPYTAYTRMNDADIHALWTYLTTLEPVVNAVDVNRLPFPLNIRLSLIGWDLLNFGTPGPVPDRADKSSAWNRGRYLVDALGHCGTCHTPKNLIGGDRGGAYLQGGALQSWFAPNITADVRTGIGGWSPEQLVAYLRDGVNHQAIASGPMAEAVVNSTSHMPEADLRAMAAYLLDGAVGPGSRAGRVETSDHVSTPAAPDGAAPRMKMGGTIYKDTCAGCHFESGQGVAGLFPKLAGHPALQQRDATTLIRVILSGSRGAATDARPTAPAMPPLGWRLDDDDVAAVLTYARNAWGNAAPPVDASDVRAVRKALAAQ